MKKYRQYYQFVIWNPRKERRFYKTNSVSIYRLTHKQTYACGESYCVLGVIFFRFGIRVEQVRVYHAKAGQ